MRYEILDENNTVIGEGECPDGKEGIIYIPLGCSLKILPPEEIEQEE